MSIILLNRNEFLSILHKLDGHSLFFCLGIRLFKTDYIIFYNPVNKYIILNLDYSVVTLYAAKVQSLFMEFLNDVCPEIIMYLCKELSIKLNTFCDCENTSMKV